MAKAALVAALVLVDIYRDGGIFAQSGQVLEADKGTIKVYEKTGEVDSNEGAVAAARERGAKTVTLGATKAAPEAPPNEDPPPPPPPPADPPA